VSAIDGIPQGLKGGSTGRGHSVASEIGFERETPKVNSEKTAQGSEGEKTRAFVNVTPTKTGIDHTQGSKKNKSRVSEKIGTEGRSKELRCFFRAKKKKIPGLRTQPGG